ncbi:MAG: hypothetical protein H7Y43_08310 [Akkermansiaceae bacterium]|nr:hypothetical protein [Verrucomicrobiales bacterium]
MKASQITRAEFLRASVKGAGAVTLLAALPAGSFAQTNSTVAPGKKPDAAGATFDLREFVNWIQNEFEPSVRLPGGAGQYARTPADKTTELYGVSDMACILYSIGALHPNEQERSEWAAAFQTFQNPETGWLIEKSRTHDPLHNTAFALAAMELLNLTPKLPIKMGPEFADIRAYLNALNWRTGVYSNSHKGAGVGSIYALVPSLGTPKWFAEYFATCDRLFDPRNGMMGQEKPAAGDSDQIGGTFHYAFLYQHFNRHMPFPERRIDSVIGLQQSDGYWLPTNKLWLTLDAIYLMTRTLRYCPHRFEDVRSAVRRTLNTMMGEVFSPEGRKKTFTGRLAVHSLTAAISTVAEAQLFLGVNEVITERPLRLILDRRPFI